MCIVGSLVDVCVCFRDADTVMVLHFSLETKTLVQCAEWPQFSVDHFLQPSEMKLHC